MSTPTWLDLRLVLGVLLVLVSVVVGARVVAAADHRRPVWVLTHELAPGSVLRSEDLARRDVQLSDAGGRYLPADVGDPSPVGYLLTRSVSAGELLPREALRSPQAAAARREVSVPVEAGHRPDDLAPGQQVDVFVTAKVSSAASTSGSGPGSAATRSVLRSVTVVSVGQRSRDGADAVVVAVPAGDGDDLVGALRSGAVDLVRVPRADEVAALDATGSDVTGSGG